MYQLFSHKYLHYSFFLGWILSDKNENCADACNKRGLICNEQDQFEHNSDIDSCSKIENLVHEIVGTKSSLQCSSTYGTAKDVPNCDHNLQLCHASVPNRPLPTFDCTSAPHPKYAMKQRLCYCNKNE